MLNFVFADVDGRIGWQTSGRLPIRSRGDGTLPYVVTDDRDNWSGWIPYEKMPGSADPRGGGWGHATISPSRATTPITTARSPPLLPLPAPCRAPGQTGKAVGRQPLALQRDDTNVMAREIAPVMAQALLRHPETAELGKILEKWDFRERADQAAPMIFHEIYERFALEVFRDELGEELARAMLSDWYFWQERLQRMVREGESPWFDDQGTPAKEGRDELFLRAALAVLAEAKAGGAGEPAKWTWGSATGSPSSPLSGGKGWEAPFWGRRPPDGRFAGDPLPGELRLQPSLRRDPLRLVADGRRSGGQRQDPCGPSGRGFGATVYRPLPGSGRTLYERGKTVLVVQRPGDREPCKDGADARSPLNGGKAGGRLERCSVECSRVCRIQEFRLDPDFFAAT